MQDIRDNRDTPPTIITTIIITSYTPKASQPTLNKSSKYAQVMVEDAIDHYNREGRQEAIDYYCLPESMDDEWYVFIVDEFGHTISHYNSDLIGQEPMLYIDSTGYPYGQELLSANENGKWVTYVYHNPTTDKEERKHTWAVRHDSLFFCSGWYEKSD